MKRIFIAFVTVVVLVANASAQQQRLDSLLRVLKTQPDPNAARMRTLIAAAKCWSTIQPDKGRECAQEAGRIAEQLNDDRARVLAWVNERWAYYYLGQYFRLDSVNRLAEALAERINDPSSIALTGDWSFWMDNSGSAAREARTQRSIAMARLSGDKALLAEVLLWFGTDARSNTNAAKLDSSMALYQSIGDSMGMAYCIVCRSNQYEPYLSDTEGTLGDLGWAASVLERQGNLIWSHWAHSNRGLLLLQKGRLAVALEEMLACLRASEAMSDPDIAAAYCNVAEIYERVGDLDNALLYYRKGADAAIDPNRRCMGINGLASVFVALRMTDSAMVHLDRAGALGIESENECYSETRGLWGLVHLLKGDTLSAIGELRSAIATSEGHDGFFTREVRYSIALANTYLRASTELLRRAGMNRTRAAAEANVLAHRALDLSRHLHVIQEERDALLMLSTLSERSGDLPNALEYHQQYTVMKDSVLNAEKARAISGLQIQYETEKKEQQIVLLGKDKEVQAKEIQKQKLVRNGFMGGFALVALFAGVFFFQRNRISKEKKRSEELLLNILPEEVAEELKTKGEADAKQIDLVTVLFTDFKGFTAMSEQLTPKELVADIHECFSAFDHIMHKHGIEKIKTIGDAYMAAGGLPTPNTTHAIDVVKAALEIRNFIAEGKALKIAKGLPYFEIRIGIHTGPVVAGIVGVKKFAYDIWGDTVNTASRMESSGEVGEVNISESTYALVKDEPGLSFTPRGKVQAKGKGEMEMYFVESPLS